MEVRGNGHRIVEDTIMQIKTKENRVRGWGTDENTVQLNCWCHFSVVSVPNILINPKLGDWVEKTNENAPLFPWDFRWKEGTISTLKKLSTVTSSDRRKNIQLFLKQEVYVWYVSNSTEKNKTKKKRMWKLQTRKETSFDQKKGEKIQNWIGLKKIRGKLKIRCPVHVWPTLELGQPVLDRFRGFPVLASAGQE